MVDGYSEQIKIGGYGQALTAFENVPNPIGIVTSDTERSSEIGKASFETEYESYWMHRKPFHEQIEILYSRFFH